MSAHDTGMMTPIELAHALHYADFIPHLQKLGADTLQVHLVLL
jgi:hypothetical protein